MSLDPAAFTKPVADVLRSYGDAFLPLNQTGLCDKDALRTLQSNSASSLFPKAHDPESALSGLLLLIGCWDQSHTASQDLSSAEGSYWHAIAHRMEPDSSNAGYWFRRVNDHPIFPQLQEAASAILTLHDIPGWRLKAQWDPFSFIQWCDEARSQKGTGKEKVALEIQMAEWTLLFNWCAASGSS